MNRFGQRLCVFASIPIAAAALFACSAVDAEPDAPQGEHLIIKVGQPEMVTGTYVRAGVAFAFEAVKSDTADRVVVSTHDGRELLRLERIGDKLITSAFGGRGRNITDMAMLQLSADMAKIPEEERPEFSLEGAFVEEGNPRAFTELEMRAEYALLPWLSRELGNQGYTGKAFPALLGLHMIASQTARAIGLELPPLDAPTEEVGYCQDLRSDPNNDDSLGMCGPGTGCWTWVCGDCCCHDGCKSHDNSCRNCKWYKPWNCFLCATFTSFLNGGCGTSCQGNSYAEGSCRALNQTCSSDSDCCNHYDSATEASAGSINTVCGSDNKCHVEGSCEGSCGGTGGGCYCDAACESYGDCCSDKTSECGYCAPECDEWEALDCEEYGGWYDWDTCECDGW